MTTIRGNRLDGRDDTSCRPSEGHTILAIGQDLFSIQEYVSSQYNASLHLNSAAPMTTWYPATTMFYTDLQSLRGLETPVDYGSGVEYARGLAEIYPDAGIQIGLWLNGTAGCRDIVSGVLDSNIQRLYHSLAAQTITRKPTSPKIFLRVGYEFDNPWFGYSDDPHVYADAFRIMVRYCEEELGETECHNRIAFVWHSWAAPKVAPLSDFYPGDDYVDWIGVSVFQQLYPWANNNHGNMATSESNNFAGGSRELVLEVLKFAKAHDKPTMIAESTPFGGLDLQDVQDPTIRAQLQEPIDIWNLWFQPTLDLIADHDIGMWSYINCDWNTQPMWKGVGFGDTRISSSSKVMDKWRRKVLENPRFLQTLDCSERITGSHEHHYHHHHHLHEPIAMPTMQVTEASPWDRTELVFFLVPKILLLLILMGTLSKCSRSDKGLAVEESAFSRRDGSNNHYGSIRQPQEEKKQDA